MELSPHFRRKQAPETGRKVVQLTAGEGFCYPLYYYISSFTQDGRYLIHHRARKGEVQLHRLDLATAESKQLTRATATDTHWYPWCTDPGRGVLDHRSVLNVVRNEVYYFNDTACRAVGVESLEDRPLFTLPEGRAAIGQNDVTPDGQWLLYIHADRQQVQAAYEKDQSPWPDRRWLVKGTALCAYHLETGAHRELLRINSPIHHVIAYDNDHVVFCHPTSEDGMLWTDLRGGWYAHLRTQDARGGVICHFLATRRGLMYEVRSGIQRAGLYDPFTHHRAEVELPRSFGYVHTGMDEQARLWFFESDRPGAHDMHLLLRHQPGGADQWMKLTGHWPCFGQQQKAHFHPRLTSDRQWIIFTAGDPDSQSNHIHLMDASDLPDTAGIPPLDGWPNSERNRITCHAPR